MVYAHNTARHKTHLVLCCSRTLLATLLGALLAALLSCAPVPDKAPAAKAAESPPRPPVVVEKARPDDKPSTEPEQAPKKALEPVEEAVKASQTAKPLPNPKPMPQRKSVLPDASPTLPTMSEQPNVQAASKPLPKAESKKPEQVPPTGSLSGQVILLGADGIEIEPIDAIVRLRKTKAGQQDIVQERPDPVVHRIDMRGKVYRPGALAIAVGDKIEFYNHDAIKHNVFSPSGDNAFDLGTYGLRNARVKEFLHEGIVKVYCNIHQDMATFVSVTSGQLSHVIKAGNQFEFDDLPVGGYMLSVWHVRGTIEQQVTVTPHQQTSVSLMLDTSTFEPEEHLNKFGEQYKKKPSLFKDEFY